MNWYWRFVFLLLGGWCLFKGILFIKDFTDLPPADSEARWHSPGGPIFIDLVVGILLIIVGAGLLAPSLVRIATAPFTAFIDSVFLPGGNANKPPPDLKLPAFYIKEERYQEALAEYQKIIRYHPDSVAGWIGAIQLLINPENDLGAARKLYQKALRQFRHHSEESRHLEDAWRDAMNDQLPL